MSDEAMSEPNVCSTVKRFITNLFCCQAKCNMEITKATLANNHTAKLWIQFMDMIDLLVLS